MKYFTFMFTFLFSVIVINLQGQTVVLTSKGKIQTKAMCVQSFYAYEENAQEIDSLKGLITIKAVNDQNSLIIHVGVHAGDYYCFIQENEAKDWYTAEVFFNTTGIYQIILRHPFDNTKLGVIDIGQTLQYNWEPEKQIGHKVRLGFPTYVCWSDLENQAHAKSYYSLFYKPTLKTN